MDRPRTGRRKLTTAERHDLLAKALVYELKQLVLLTLDEPDHLRGSIASQVRGFTSACRIVEKALDVRILKDNQEGAR